MERTEEPEVIDLLSSEEDEVVVVVARRPGKKRDREGSPGQRKGSKATGKDSFAPAPHKVARKDIQSRRDSRKNKEPRKKKEPRSLHTSEVRPIVLDDDGSDNAVITYGVMELVHDLIVPRTTQSSWTANLLGRARSHCGIIGPHRDSSVVHIQQNDTWSCGFRNTQMILSAMIPQFSTCHSYFHANPRRSNRTLIPTLKQMQIALEQSWKAGFDQRAANHYRHKIVGKTKWIGAAEVTSLLSYWGIDATLVQFVACRKSRMLLPSYVKAYFSKQLGRRGCPFCCSSDSSMTSTAKAEELRHLVETSGGARKGETQCDCPCLPLYLQWEGHSVTLVGIETVPTRLHKKKNDGINYLVLDPLKQGSKINDGLRVKKALDPLRLDAKSLFQKDAQLVYCSLRPLSPSERDLEVKSVTAAKEAVKRALGL